MYNLVLDLTAVRAGDWVAPVTHDEAVTAFKGWHPAVVEAERKANAIVADLRAGKMSKAADIVEQTVHETLTYYVFPDIHWQKIRTNNPLERIMLEIRRRTRVVGIT